MSVRRFFLGMALAMILPAAVRAQSFDTLYEYGNAAQSSATSGAGKARGADFSGSASGNYTLTAGGTDFWDVSDNGSAIFDADGTPVTGNFSATVKVSIGLQGETMPGEWGRTGIMARNNPSAANSAYFASTQKFDGPKQHVLQFRDAENAGTNRVSDGVATTLKVGNTGAGVPVWMGLHRYGDQIFSTWAPDVNGAPGAWSIAEGKVGSPDQLAAVQLGLFHQNHSVQPKTSTATFEGFKSGDFNNALGVFPLNITRDLGITGGKLSGKLNGVEIGGGAAQAVNWKVEVLGTPVIDAGLHARSFLRGNGGTNFDPDSLPAQGDGVVANVSWWGNAVAPAGFEKYPDVFGLPADTNANGDNQENYSVDLQGQIFIPEAGTYKFKDGVDDYTFLSIGGQTLIDDNNWTGPTGSDNGGSPIVEKSFDQAGWYDFTFRMAEGGGGDSGTLYWDYHNGAFPASNDKPAGTDALVPAANFRHITYPVLDSLNGESIVDGVLTDASGKSLSLPAGTTLRLTVNGKSEMVTLVPEPASIGLVALSVLGLLGARRRRS